MNQTYYHITLMKAKKENLMYYIINNQKESLNFIQTITYETLK